ncbi:hypothetical protein FRC08_017297 [Ceratobasidium sp. 394]|nr:hypothetical protein FRC08_017297 [Ceratobasidium sp. 394]
MADFFTTTSISDKAVSTATTQHDGNAQIAPEKVGHMSETKESGKGSNFSMCEIIM